ncbi:DUF148 domain-containing protein [Caenorhabditis elegans]|uniref:DUF148 domain-containing protein n=1 Tax=Caenorhabditis elegans TaxID=6239 RepID=O17553_CAEEL|nr:DUF148 domain-containing protein [Caenorhabditis elegans]CAB07546.1 DUF148 domain-containing protein [Caenorhabditis elegans]|eukprot:NP_499666.1 Uncharacterized protein CELE_BE10.4 [Caenorhabditis elegans]
MQILSLSIIITVLFQSSYSNYQSYHHKDHINPNPQPYHQGNAYEHQAYQGLQNIHDDLANQYHQELGYPTGPPLPPPPPPQPANGYQDPQNYQNHYESPPSLSSASAASCLSRIRLAATFDPIISAKINRFIDSMRIDRLRAYVCERTAYFCDEVQQKEVGDLFHQYDRSIEIIDKVRHELTSTEKDQLNMMENLNDTLAEQTFFVYKFHQLNPVDLAVLTSAKASLTTALSATDPDASLSKAMGSFSPQDLERMAALPVSQLPEEVRSHLARCQITAPEVVHDTVAFLLSVMGSKQTNYR